ncbi:uncharacterized protein LOC135217565 isoform X1 [Macrobrachium nipponense]|uniref:uncharacterized protein LOC135217565 isoform X1 n=1 Tax=Macrobrachium nipponense TaxID=159736 RepID=UPI0030C873C5
MDIYFFQRPEVLKKYYTHQPTIYLSSTFDVLDPLCYHTDFRLGGDRMCLLRRTQLLLPDEHHVDVCRRSLPLHVSCQDVRSGEHQVACLYTDRMGCSSSHHYHLGHSKDPNNAYTSHWGGGSGGMEELDIEGLWSNVCPLMAVSNVDWIQKVAVLFLLSTNIIFLLRIMWVLITKLRSANNVETQRYWKATKALLVLIPLLGLTYMLLIILPKELEHVQAILLSTQGFWVAVFFCFLNSEVQNSIRHHIERWKAERGMIDPRGASVRLSRDGSPRPRFGCSRKGGRLFGGKRESLCTDSTTMTTVVINGCNTNSSAVAPPAVSPQPSRRISKASSLIPLADQDTRISVTDSTI